MIYFKEERILFADTQEELLNEADRLREDGWREGLPLQVLAYDEAAKQLGFAKEDRPRWSIAMSRVKRMRPATWRTRPR